jgi:hypothetical protein
MNKKPLQSKKFIALFFCILAITGVLVTALLSQAITWPMAFFMSVGMLAIGALSVGYILGQTSLDKFLGSVSSLKNNEQQS